MDLGACFDNAVYINAAKCCSKQTVNTDSLCSNQN